MDKSISQPTIGIIDKLKYILVLGASVHRDFKRRSSIFMFMIFIGMSTVLGGCGAFDPAEGNGKNSSSAADSLAPTPQEMLLIQVPWRRQIQQNSVSQRQSSCLPRNEISPVMRKILQDSGIVFYQGNTPPDIGGYHLGVGWVEQSIGGRPAFHRIYTHLSLDSKENQDVNFSELDLKGRGWITGTDRQFTACIEIPDTEQPIMLIVSGTKALKKIYTSGVVINTITNKMETIYIEWDYLAQTKAEHEANLERQRRYNGSENDQNNKKNPNNSDDNGDDNDDDNDPHDKDNDPPINPYPDPPTPPDPPMP